MTGLPAAFLAAPIAHRGLHDPGAGPVENSRAAVRAAAAAGYGVEIDVQLAADGEAMVFHDADLDRMTDYSGPLGDLASDTLGQIALRGGETIPTLAEILRVAGDVPLLIEIKDQNGACSPRGVGPLEARVAAAIRGRYGPTAVMSFNPHVVAEFGRAAPDRPRGLVACAAEGYGPQAEDAVALARLERFDALGAAFASYDWRALPTPETERLRAAGAPLLCWTVRSAAEEREARRHADNVTFEGYRPAARR